MPRPIPTVLVALAGLTMATSAWAQSGILTLREAIDQALTANHNVRLAQERIRSAEIRVQESTAQALPQVSLSGNFSQQNPVGPPKPMIPGLAPEFAAFTGAARVNNLQTTLQASQVVFAGFRVIDGIRLANMTVDQAAAGMEQAKAEITFATVQSYFNALRAINALELSQQAVDQAKAHLGQAEKFFAAGTGIKVDVLRAKTNLYQAQQQLSQAVNNRRKALQGLNLVMGRPIDAPIELNLAAEVGQAPVDETQALDESLKLRPEIRRLMAQKDANELLVSINSRGTWPQLSLFGQYGVRDTAVVQANSANQQNATLGLNMNWPLFDGLAVAAKTEQARLTVEQDAIQLDQTIQTVRMEVNQAFLDMHEASERRMLADESLKAAQEALRLARLRYQAGVGTSLEVIDAQTGWQQARLSQINAVFDENVNRAKLYKAIGYAVADARSLSAGGDRG